MSFNKVQVMKEMRAIYASLREHNSDKAVVGFGGALVMMGLRNTTRDLDLNVDPEHYQYVEGIAGGEGSSYHFKGIFSNGFQYGDHIDFHEDVIAEEDVVVIDGVRCYSPELLLKRYRILKSRRKNEAKMVQDQKAIEALEAYIELLAWFGTTNEEMKEMTKKMAG